MASADQKKGRLFILSAPSGTGKSTLCKRLLARFPDMHYSVSHTTRPPRNGEVEGADYHFISQEEFESRIREGRWAEWARVHGNYYGTSADRLAEEMAAGRDILLDIDVNGARQIREKFPESIAIFILPPSMEALRQRLEKRSSDSPAVIAKRLKAAEEEIACSGEYPHVIVNDDLETAAADLIGLIENYRNKDAPLE